jgi:N-carbamoyl-L-amino-acid hydrolase
VEPQRVVADLQRLRCETGDAAGAQRVAWTPTWARARQWLRAELDRLPVIVEVDAAGNLWATLAGDSPEALAVGSHLDSVPAGGWLDGCLGVLAALEVLRGLAAGPRPRRTVRLVEWADEEGARFGRSLLGSSAAAGLLQPAEVCDLTDADGVRLSDALAEHGVDLEAASRAGARGLQDVAAYVELHIEQGPVLEAAGLGVGVVEGIAGLHRTAITCTGRTAHAGSTPMHLRRDALVGASRLVLEVRRIAEQAGGVATVGEIRVQPGIPTAIPGTATLLLDQRHQDLQALTEMVERTRSASDAIAEENGTPVRWRVIQHVDPIRFDPSLVRVAEESVRAVTGECLRLPSGALHDAATMARAGIPSVMLFVQSLGGVSHSRAEDSRREHLEQGVLALDRLTQALVR